MDSCWWRAPYRRVIIPSDQWLQASIAAKQTQVAISFPLRHTVYPRLAVSDIGTTPMSLCYMNTTETGATIVAETKYETSTNAFTVIAVGW